MDSSETSWVFSYGTLQSERVLQAVLGRVPHWSPATISGFKRSALGGGRCYPGVCRAASGGGAGANRVRGRVLRGVTADELATLDRFEGDEYAPVVVAGVRLDSGESVAARLWLLEDTSGLLEEEWSFERFMEEDEGWYVRMCMEWAEEDKVEKRKCTPQQRGGD